MKKYFVCLASMLAMSQFSMAQSDPDANYIRNSLYMIKLQMPDDDDESYQEANVIMDKAFKAIDFDKRYPRYNDFCTGIRHIDFKDLPSVTQDEIDAIDKETKIEQIIREQTNKVLLEQGLKRNTLREAEYAAKLLKYFDQEHFANKLVAKWYSPKGCNLESNDKWNLEVIQELGLKGLSEEAKAEALRAENLTNAASGIAATNKLLNNTYVCVNRYGYMSAEEVVAACTAVLQAKLETLPALAQAPVKLLMAKVTSGIKGYFVRANAYLFQLDWQNGTADFYKNYWNSGQKPADFIANGPYKMKYIGKLSKRAPATLSLKAANKKEELITRATLRGTDAAIAALQRDNEDFRPMSSLHEDNGRLVAYIGTKEDVKEGDSFQVYQKQEGKDGLIDWVEIGTIKVDKGGVWDNREGAGQVIEGESEDKTDDEKSDSNLKYTIFKGKPGKMGEGCLIRMAGKKDKNKKK